MSKELDVSFQNTTKRNKQYEKKNSAAAIIVKQKTTYKLYIFIDAINKNKKQLRDSHADGKTKLENYHWLFRRN